MGRALAWAAAWIVASGCGSRTGLGALEIGAGLDGGVAEGSGPLRDSSLLDGGSDDGDRRDASGDGSPEADSAKEDSGPCLSVGLATLATNQASTLGLAVDATHVYWTTFSGGTVMKVPLCGGAPTTLATAAGPSFVAVDSTNVYWAQNQGPECPQCVGILKATLGGGASAEIASQVNATAVGLAASNGSVYWVDQTLGVMSVLPSGGTITTLASQRGGTSSGIAVDATSVYWMRVKAGTVAVMTVPSTGGASVTLASGPDVGSGAFDQQSISINATGVYWGTPDSIRGMPKGGGTPTALAVPWGPTQPGDMVVDEANVYWVNQDKDVVMKAPLAGGAPVTLATGQHHPRAIAVDATSVYWATASTASPPEGDIMKLTPK